jgi:hypothetical protein
VDPHHFDADPDANLDSTYHPDANPDANLDSTYHPDADPLIFYLMRILDPTFHPDADPDPDSRIKKMAQTLEKVIK